MQEAVAYLMSGPAHIPYLVASVASLREHWDGPVLVHAYPQSYGLVSQMAEDRRLNIRPVLWEPQYNGKNGQFLNKIIMMRRLAVGKALYLDADTLPVASPAPLFEACPENGACFTQFNDWQSNSGIPKKRVSRLVGRDGIPQTAVESAINFPLISPNGGVFAACPQSPVLRLWEEWTRKVLDLFIADETVLHAIIAATGPDPRVGYAVGGAWNCSPKFQPAKLADEDVKIWHFHGDSNVRKTKSPRGIGLWWPVYERCLALNLGGIVNLQADCGNKYLDKLLAGGDCFYCEREEDGNHRKGCPNGRPVRAA